MSPQVNGFQSSGSSPRRSAATWKAQPVVPDGPSPVFWNTQWPPLTRVWREPGCAP